MMIVALCACLILPVNPVASLLVLIVATFFAGAFVTISELKND